jgi:lysyl-tRNA synthetase class 2
MCTEGQYEGDFSLTRVMRKGDIISVRGIAAKSNKGELSVVPREMSLLSPCKHELPETLTDPEIRFRQRYLDFLVNARTRETFVLRSKMMASLRRFLMSRDFLEVETPVLWPNSGGASARPFTTRSHAMGKNLDLYMRISPELFLKQLVIGGMDRVFEIGKLFRNEGIDATHNPEFTSCEFYQAYADLADLFEMTETIIREMLMATVGTLEIALPDGSTVDFAPPFRRIDIMPALEAKLHTSLPDPNAEASLPEYHALCRHHGLEVSAPVTLARCIDKLIGEFLEPECVGPTFLIHHPECLGPLAKSSATRPGITQRFELFVNGRELVNAYEELNDPVEQRKRMQVQASLQAKGDNEAQPPDENFCNALSYGLPPTAGWGMGLDRMCMLLTGHTQIREVLLYPALKPEEEQREKEGE